MTKGNLKELMVFPATAYTKENGYLGIVGLDRTSNELYISSKSNVKGKFAEMLRGIVNSLGAEKVMFIKQYLKENDVTLVFESVKYKEDPHIIKYTEDKIVLLAIVENKVHYSERNYNEVIAVANKLGVELTKPAVTLNSWEEFKLFYKNCMDEDVYDLEGVHIEGFVIKCINGFNVKLKMPYYNYWKKFRGLIERYKKGNETVMDDLNEYEKEIVKIGAEMFYREKDEVNVIALLDDNRVKDLVKKLSELPSDVIS